VTKKREKLFS